MEYWKGAMNWPLDKGWKCKTCGATSGFTWGLIHALFRCDTCHTEYRMRDKENNVVTTPILQLKPEYVVPVKTLWERDGKPVSEMDMDDLNRLRDT